MHRHFFVNKKEAPPQSETTRGEKTIQVDQFAPIF
jgi:hypothetical protein